ncbi:MAG: hypothetical protein WCH65_06665 [bacterium]
MEVTNKDVSIFEEKLSKINAEFRMQNSEKNVEGKFDVVRRNTLK